MKKCTPKVSVIVPVYNTEKYLEKCLNSLAGQTLEDIEIIVVNDGSPDNSQEIIDTFLGKYPDKIVALRQENKGLGQARNTGVKQAKGEYIGFVDSDDWVAPDMFELMYETAKQDNADVTMCGFYMVSENESECRAEEIWRAYKADGGSVAEHVINSTNPAMACNKLFKRELPEKTEFTSGYYEDLATIPVILSNCERISIVKKPLYYYFKHAGAITSQRNNPKNLDVIKAWERCQAECNAKYREEMAYAVYFSVCFYLDFRREHLNEYFDYFCKSKDTFKNNKYIEEKIQGNRLADLFKIATQNGAAAQAPTMHKQAERNNKSKQRINIMTSCDDYLAMYIMPQLVSIRENLKDYDVHFYLAHSRIADGDIKLLKEFAQNQCGIAFHEARVGDDAFYESFVKSGSIKWPRETYYTLLPQEILPEDVDRVMYIDAGDVIIDGDISPYYFDDFEGKSLIATSIGYKTDPETGKPELHTSEDILDIATSGVFNSGCYVINVEKLRAEGYSKNDYLYLLSVLKENAKPENKGVAHFGDQGFLSTAFVGDIKFFGYPQNTDPMYMPYNFRTSYWAQYKIKNDPPYKPVVIHYTVNAKPFVVRFTPGYIDMYIDRPDFISNNLIAHIPAVYWLTAQHLRLCETWWKYAEMTPIYDELDMRARVTANSWMEHFLPVCRDYNDLMLKIEGQG